VYRKGQNPIAPNREHDLFELFVIFGDRPRVAGPEGVCVGGGGEGCTEAYGSPGRTEHNSKWTCSWSPEYVILLSK
jgi:hypothetical protein